MYPHEVMRHAPGGGGFLHGDFPGLFWLVPSTLFTLLLLALLGVLLWFAGRAILGRRRSQPQAQAQAPLGAMGQPVSAVELLRQRYARGEIDGDTFQVMLGQLRASDPATTTGSGADEGGQWQNV